MCDKLRNVQNSILKCNQEIAHLKEKIVAFESQNAVFHLSCNQETPSSTFNAPFEDSTVSHSIPSQVSLKQ